MTDTFRCFVPGDPKPKGSKRVFMVEDKITKVPKPVMVEANKDVQSWEYLMIESFASARSDILIPFPDGAVELTLQFRLRRPKSAKKRARPHVRPDIDKLERAVLDALVGAAVIGDDGQVVSKTTEKVYADGGLVPGVSVEVRRL